jgi:hypothetical protein
LILIPYDLQPLTSSCPSSWPARAFSLERLSLAQAFWLLALKLSLEQLSRAQLSLQALEEQLSALPQVQQHAS